MDFQVQEKATAGIFKFLASSITIGVISLLLAVTINPIEFVRFQRDRQRTRDLKSLSDLILKVEEIVPQAVRSVGNFVYLSLPDNDPNCGSWSSKGLPPIPNGYVYRCVSDVNLTRVDGLGWLPINFKELPGFSLSKLPLDPRNGTVGYDSEKEKDVLYFYQYVSGSPILSYSSSESQAYENKQTPLERAGVENDFGFVSISGSLPGSSGEVFVANRTGDGLIEDVKKILEISKPAIRESLIQSGSGVSETDLENVVDNLISVSVATIRDSVNDLAANNLSNPISETLNSIVSSVVGVGNNKSSIAAESQATNKPLSNTINSSDFSQASNTESEGVSNSNTQSSNTESSPNNPDQQNNSNDQTGNTSLNNNSEICSASGGAWNGFRCLIPDNKDNTAPSFNQNDFGKVLPKYVLIPRDYKFYKKDFTSMTSSQNDSLNWSKLGKPNEINLIYGVVNEGFNDVPAGSLSFKLEQAPLIGGLACNDLDGWSTVTSNSRPVAYDTLSNFSDDSPIIPTIDGLKMGVPEILQTWQNKDNSIIINSIKKGSAGVFGFNLRVNDPDAQGIDCLRMVFSDGSLLYYYSPVLPQIVFSNDFPTLPDFNVVGTSASTPSMTDTYQQYMLWMQQHYPGSTIPTAPTNSTFMTNPPVSASPSSQILADSQLDKRRWKRFFASVYDVFSAFNILNLK